jgi:hypothetical protein
MNERILELARVAEQLADDELAHLERVHNRLYSFTEGREIYNKKFAELIVKEAGKYLTRPEFIGRSDLDWSMILNEHFGVEK